MKVVFSRKGFDSGAGGFPSPIIEAGRLVCQSPRRDDPSRHMATLGSEILLSS
jgi:hypothetical protein